MKIRVWKKTRVSTKCTGSKKRLQKNKKNDAPLPGSGGAHL